MPDPLRQLIAIEREILHFIAQGLDNAVIARRVVLTGKSVRNPVGDMLTKLRVRCALEGQLASPAAAELLHFAAVPGHFEVSSVGESASDKGL
jgi:DNA-binding NarL/FixJ family response regulator